MAGESPVILKTELPLPLFVKGKVRDTYEIGEMLLIVATDRISAFDVVLPCGIPDKGLVLNKMSAFWFKKTSDIVPNHFIDIIDDVRRLDEYLPLKKRFDYPTYLNGRSMLVKKVARLNIECVVRGYLSGSAWTEYQRSGSVCGIPLPKGLLESQELPEPIFTPTTKADTGHDQPLTMEMMREMIDRTLADDVRRISLDVYGSARAYARERGIIIADTKMEFGLIGNKVILIDELLTPDSSRLWDVNLYKVGHSQPSLDKQPVRDWLVKSGWNKEPPAPQLPCSIITKTSRIYRQAYERLTGEKVHGKKK